MSRFPWIKLWRSPFLADEGLKQLSPAAFKAFVYSLAGADRDARIGYLHHDGKPLTVRDKACLWGCSTGAVAKLEAQLIDSGFLILDKRCNPPLLMVKNYVKWQVEKNGDGCSLGEQQANGTTIPCSLGEHGRSLSEQQRSLGEQFCSLGEHLCSLSEQTGHECNDATKQAIERLSAAMRSLSEQVHAQHTRPVEVREQQQITAENDSLDPPAAGPSVPVEAVVVNPSGWGGPDTPEAPTTNQTQPATDGAPRLSETPDAVTEADPEPDNRTYLSEPDPLKRAIWRCWSALGLEGPPASDMAADGKTPTKQYSGWYKLAQEHGDRKVNAWASVIERTKPTLPESKKPGAWFSTIFRNAMRAHWTWGWDETTQKLKEPRQAPGPVAMPQEYVDKVAEDLKDWWEGK